MLEKVNWFHLIGLITLVLLIWKWMVLFWKKNHLLRCCGWLSHLKWIGALKLSLLLKLAPRKLEHWFVLWSFFLLRLLCIYKSIMWPCMEYCCHVWDVDHSCYLVFLEKDCYRDSWSFTCCLTLTLGSSSKYSQFKSFI